MTVVVSFTERFIEFLGQSPSSFHAAAEVARRLVEAGFSAQGPSGRPAARGVMRRGGAVIAWVLPSGESEGAASAGSGEQAPGYRIVGAHTDSPGLVAKPHPAFTASGYQQIGVEIYGSPLLNSWLDRELCFAGRLTLTDGSEHLVRTGPIARVPQLAIHLDREVGQGLVLDRQRHLQPVWSLAGGDQANLIADIAGAENLPVEAVAGAELIAVDAQPPARFGRNGEFLAAGRLDNLTSVFAGLEALASAPPPRRDTLVFVAFSHEEVGSETPTGAAGPLLSDTLDRLAAWRNADGEIERAYRAASWLISADAGHAVHPNYPEKHDPNLRPTLGAGPLLKINANARYATDAEGYAVWARATGAAGVAGQVFVSNNDVPCGSTIGPIAATRTGIRTVDVGAPVLSMHSAREMCHPSDVEALSASLSAFYAGA